MLQIRRQTSLNATAWHICGDSSFEKTLANGNKPVRKGGTVRKGRMVTSVHVEFNGS
jgi:hypothetical protein